MATEFSHMPAFPPPPGVTPKFVNPPSISWLVTAVSLPFSCAATIFVALRLYTRYFIIRSLGLDDLFIFISLLISWGFCALGFAAIPYGYGVDLWNLYVADVTTFLKIDLIAQVTYFLSTLFLKLSILLFYLRLSPDTLFRRTAYAIGIFDIIYIFLSIGIAVLGCKPLAGSWDIIFFVQAKCVNKKAYYYAQAVFNIVTDFATLGLPIKMCLGLHLPSRQRWLLGMLFTLGSFACVVSIIRLVTMVPSLRDFNFTRFKVQIAAWCEVEANTGIICACLPCLKPLMNHAFPALMASSSSNLSSNEPSSNSFPMSTVTSSKHRGAERLSGEERFEVEADEIKKRIRGWSGVGNTDVVGREDGESRRGILEEDWKGVVKTVGYDVKYDSS